MGEIPVKLSLPMLERFVYALGLAALAAIILAMLYTSSVSTWLATSGFLQATTCALASVGMLVGHARLGAAIGVFVGAVYLGMLFRWQPNGGHWPGMPGWPIEFPVNN